ncbi:MAG: YlbE-like family protein [Bacilli bacterium]|nr:YlbE-like family protein [Bacilli bacterium]
MNLETIIKIKNNALLQRYIRENSYWYKILNRNPNMLNYLEEEMKKAYKLTTTDKINDLSNKIDLIKTFMNAFK